MNPLHIETISSRKNEFKDDSITTQLSTGEYTKSILKKSSSIDQNKDPESLEIIRSIRISTVSDSHVDDDSNISKHSLTGLRKSSMKKGTEKDNINIGILLSAINEHEEPEIIIVDRKSRAISVRSDVSFSSTSNMVNNVNKNKPFFMIILEYFIFLSPSWSGWIYEKQKVIRSFNVIKVLYIFFLVPYHITIAARIVTGDPSYASYDLPYPTVSHGLEYMAGLLFISGWLSHATTKPGTTFMELMKKKILRLLPSYYVGAIPMTLLCIIYEAATNTLGNPHPTYVIYGASGWEVGVQFILELLTLGSWNPALMFWTRNRPLWFISTLLMYHYCSSSYLPWIRSCSTSFLLFLILFYVCIRVLSATIFLYVLTVAYPTTYFNFPRISETWSVIQIYLPFIGATLAECSKRIGEMKWSRNAIWRLTDLSTVVTFALSFFVISPPAWNNDEATHTMTGFYVNSLCAYTNLIVMPMLLVTVYLQSHDISTLTWVYTRFPRLFDEGLACSYPFFLIYWPILLMLQQSNAYVSNNSAVSVIMIFCVTLLSSIVIDRYIITPVEDLIVAFVDPPKPKSIKEPASIQISQRSSTIIKETFKNQLETLQSQLDQKELIIDELDRRVEEKEQEILELKLEIERRDELLEKAEYEEVVQEDRLSRWE